MRKLMLSAVLLPVLFIMSSCSQLDAEVPSEASETLTYAEAVAQGAAVGAGGEEDAKALEAEMIAYGLQDADESNDDLLMMVRDLGGFAEFDRLMFSLSDEEAETLLAKYNIDFFNTSPGSGNDGELSSQRVTDCIDYFPPSDRQGTGGINRSGVHRVTAPLESGLLGIGRIETLVLIDRSGRPARASYSRRGIFTATTKPDKRCQSKVGNFNGARSDDEGGHMVGRQLGGYNRRANLVPQNRNFNRGNFVTVENVVKECNSRVSVFAAIHRYGVQVLYTDSRTLRPNQFNVAYEVNNAVTGRQILRRTASFQNRTAGGISGRTIARNFRDDVRRRCR